MSSLLRLVQWLRALVYFATKSDKFHSFNLFQWVGIWFEFDVSAGPGAPLRGKFQFYIYRPHLLCRNLVDYLVTRELAETEMLPLDLIPFF